MVPGPPGPPAAPDRQRVIIGSVIGCAALVTIAAIFVVWKWKQKKLSESQIDFLLFSKCSTYCCSLLMM